MFHELIYANVLFDEAVFFFLFLKIWVYGNSFKSMIVAVVVPEEETTKKWAYLNGHMGSFSDLCSLDQLKDHIMAELKLIAERNKVIIRILIN